MKRALRGWLSPSWDPAVARHGERASERAASRCDAKSERTLAEGAACRCSRVRGIKPRESKSTQLLKSRNHSENFRGKERKTTKKRKEKEKALKLQRVNKSRWWPLAVLRATSLFTTSHRPAVSKHAHLPLLHWSLQSSASAPEHHTTQHPLSLSLSLSLSLLCSLKGAGVLLLKRESKKPRDRHAYATY